MLVGHGGWGSGSSVAAVTEDAVCLRIDVFSPLTTGRACRGGGADGGARSGLNSRFWLLCAQRFGDRGDVPQGFEVWRGKGVGAE